MTDRHVICPHCERFEVFSNELTALAWVFRHIWAEHDDELPPYEGVDDD